MFESRWHLFRLVGIPIRLHVSWLIILALLTWTLAEIFRSVVTDLPPGDYWAMALSAALAFFACIVLHELGHAVVARAYGIPIRGITLFLFGGVAELEKEPESATGEFFMAIAGPAVSLFLALGFLLVAVLGELAGWPAQVIAVLTYLFWINGVVLVFNLVPAFPLDGGRVLRSILWCVIGSLRRATWWAALGGQAFAWLLLVGGFVQFLHGNLAGGIWFVLIGLFLENAAKSSYQQVVVRQMLQGEPVRRFMNKEPIVVSPALDLKHWVDDFVYRYHRKAFPVMSNGHVEGLITTRALNEFPRAEWERHTVAEAMLHDLTDLTIEPGADAVQALTQMQRTGASRLLVVDDGRLVGIVSLKDLLGFLDLKLELENDPQSKK